MRITPALLVIGLAVSGALAPATPAGGVAHPATNPGTVQLAIIAPVTVPPTRGGMLDAAALEEYTTPAGLLAMQLGQLGGRPVTLAIDPMILASIRSLGTSAPESATSWLSRLAESKNESFALEWGDANPVLAIQAGRSVLGPPEIPVNPALFSPEGLDPVEQEPGEPVIPELPSQEDLVAWAHSLGRIAWPADHSMNGADLEGLNAAGFDGVVINSSSVAATTIKSPHVALGTVDGIVSNDIVSSLLRATVAAPTDEAWALSFEGLSSVLAAHAVSDVDVVLAASLGRFTTGSPLRLSQTLNALGQLEWIELVPVSAVLEQPAVSTTIETRDAADPRATMINELLAAEEAVRAFSSVLDNPAPVVSTRRERLLDLLSTGWDPASPLWTTIAEQYLTDCRDIVGAVTITDSSLINLLADNGHFPVTVRNALAHPVTVYVTVSPERPIVRVMESRVELSVAANSQAKALIPVQTVANGKLFATVSLSSSDRTSVSTPVRVELNVQAGWETMATAIVFALVGLMLIAGIWRTVRARRRTVASRDPSRSEPHEGAERNAPKIRTEESGS